MLQSKMKGSRQGKKEAGTSFFRHDGSFFRNDKSQSKRNNKTSKISNVKSGEPVLGTDSSKLLIPVRFDTKDRLVSSVQSYMALFCSLGDAGMSLSTSVHSVLSEIGFMEIAGQFSKNFNDMNDISMATFDEMKNFVEKVVDAWENSYDGKLMTTQSVLQVLAYLLKTQLDFLRTAAEHISEVLNTQYSGKTMLELLGGEEFFLTPPSTPTKPQTAASASEPKVTQSPPSSSLSTGNTVVTAQPIVKEKTLKNASDQSSTISSSTSKTSDESLGLQPPSDKVLASIIDMLSGTGISSNKSGISSGAKTRTRGQPNFGSAVPGASHQYSPFLYPTGSNAYAATMASALATQPQPCQTSLSVPNHSQSVFNPALSAAASGEVNTQLLAMYMSHGLDPRMMQASLTGGLGDFNMAANVNQYVNQQRWQNMYDPVVQQQLLAQTALQQQQQQRTLPKMPLDDSSVLLDRPTVQRTHTWPLRPEKGDCDYSAMHASQSFQHSKDVKVDDVNLQLQQQQTSAVDLEFSQFISAIQRRTRGLQSTDLQSIELQDSAVGGLGGARAVAGNRGSLDNPWSAGDSAMAWPPRINLTDGVERRQWPEEDSICSDESSSNHGGDYMLTSESLAREQLLAAKEAFHKVAMNETKSTRTWPLKQDPLAQNRFNKYSENTDASASNFAAASLGLLPPEMNPAYGGALRGMLEGQHQNDLLRQGAFGVTSGDVRAQQKPHPAYPNAWAAAQ